MYNCEVCEATSKPGAPAIVHREMEEVPNRRPKSKPGSRIVKEVKVCSNCIGWIKLVGLVRAKSMIRQKRLAHMANRALAGAGHKAAFKA